MVKRINMIKECVGTTFRHFKGDLYLLLYIGEDTETGEEVAIYKALYGDCKVYVRKLEMFSSEVDKEKYPNAIQQYRFVPVEVKSRKK